MERFGGKIKPPKIGMFHEKVDVFL